MTLEAVGFEHSAEELAWAEEMLLADELIERARAHAGGERGGGVEVFLDGLSRRGP
jgi:hypothetical protein